MTEPKVEWVLRSRPGRMYKGHYYAGHKDDRVAKWTFTREGCHRFASRTDAMRARYDLVDPDEWRAVRVVKKLKKGRVVYRQEVLVYTHQGQPDGSVELGITLAPGTPRVSQHDVELVFRERA